MNTTTIAVKQPLIRKTKRMNVLWGAWIKGVEDNPSELYAFDVVGIYDHIHKKKKADFPFVVDLQIVLACRVTDHSEFGRIYKLTFDFHDRFGINKIFIMEDQIMAYEGDLPVQIYETYKFNNVTIKEPDFYNLSVLIDGYFVLSIPLWITAPKMTIFEDAEKGITTELWPEDYDDYKSSRGNK